MSTVDLVLLMVLVAWLAVGPVLGVVMGRHGHSPAAWAVLGILFGPPGRPDRPRRPVAETGLAVAMLAAGGSRHAGVAVLAGIDGSEEAVLALTRPLPSWVTGSAVSV